MSTSVFRRTGIRAVLFDLDGTLLDSAPDLAATAQTMRERRQMPALPLSAYRAHSGSGARGMLHVAFGMAAEHPEFDAMKAEFFDIYQGMLAEHTRPFDGVVELLDRLHNAGLPWGVVTNKAERFTLPLTASMPLFARAAAIVSGDTTPHAKPHPEPLFEAARRAGIEPQHCVYVGDDLRDIQAGRSAGMQTVAACYGYLGLGADTNAWGADKSIQNPLELLNWLEVP